MNQRSRSCENLTDFRFRLKSRGASFAEDKEAEVTVIVLFSCCDGMAPGTEYWFDASGREIRERRIEKSWDVNQ